MQLFEWQVNGPFLFSFQHPEDAVAKWEESKKQQKKMESLKNQMKEKDFEIEKLTKSNEHLRNALDRFARRLNCRFLYFYLERFILYRCYRPYLFMTTVEVDWNLSSDSTERKRVWSRNCVQSRCAPVRTVNWRRSTCQISVPTIATVNRYTVCKIWRNATTILKMRSAAKLFCFVYLPTFQSWMMDLNWVSYSLVSKCWNINMNQRGSVIWTSTLY